MREKSKIRGCHGGLVHKSNCTPKPFDTHIVLFKDDVDERSPPDSTSFRPSFRSSSRRTSALAIAMHLNNVAVGRHAICQSYIIINVARLHQTVCSSECKSAEHVTFKEQRNRRLASRVASRKSAVCKTSG